MSYIDNLRNKLRYSGLMHVLLDGLRYVGIVVFPYVLFRRSVPDTVRPIPEDDPSEFCELTEADIEQIVSLDRVQGTIDFYQDLFDQGQHCYGLRVGGELIGFCWADFRQCHFKGEHFELEKHEAYGHDIYTLPSERGRNYAPLLNAHFSRMLLDNGITRVYSIIDRFNHPSLNFAAKIGCEKVRMGLYLAIGEWIDGSWVLRRYPPS